MEVIEDKNINIVKNNKNISAKIHNRKYFIDYK